MTELDKLFEEEEKIQASVLEISQGLLDLSDYSNAKSAVDLAEAEVVGKRIRNACDKINGEVHHAKQRLGALLTNTTKVKFKKGERKLHEMENELSMIHGDVEAIGTIAEGFYDAKDRKAAFDNLNQHYSELVKHVTSLMVEESELKKLL